MAEVRGSSPLSSTRTDRAPHRGPSFVPAGTLARVPSQLTPLGLVAVYSVPDGWRASVQRGAELRSTRITYASPRAALLAVTRAAADTPWLVELEAAALADHG